MSQLRRDLRALLGDLRGERAPAWLPRDGSRYGGVGLATRELEIVELIRETPSAVSLVFADPSGRELPSIRPGQFFTLLVAIDGQVLRRAYSVSSDCRERGRFSLTVKRVAGGRVSNFLTDHAAPGMRLRLLGPSGSFGVEPRPERARKLVMIAGGSGITPMMAILRTAPAIERDSQFVLVYGNRSAGETIFADELEAIAREQGGRVRVVSALEQPPADWRGAHGRLEPGLLAELLDAEPLADDPEAEFLLCGPAAMMEGALAHLDQRGVGSDRVRVERFTSPELRADEAARLDSPQPLTVGLHGRELGVTVHPGQTLLEAGLAAGLDMPYSCAMGGCAACKVRLERGAVVMREPNCLSESEREQGWVLACVASPTGPCRVRVERSPGVEDE